MDTSDMALSSNGESYVHHGTNSASPAVAGWVSGSMVSGSTHERDMSPTRSHRPRNSQDYYTVLIVDDDESIADLLADLLESEGYRAVVAHDGISALEYARGQRPDMILSDCMMPGLSGTQLAQELRRGPATRSIALVLMSSTQPRGMNVEHVPFLAKPFEIDDVLALVEQYTHGPVSTQLYGEG